MPVCGSMLRTFITILCLTALTGCAACLPGQSRLDKGMVEENSAQERLSDIPLENQAASSVHRALDGFDSVAASLALYL